MKFVAKQQPVPPENKTPFPWTPVEFKGLTALAWIDDNGPRPRIAWSYRAEEMVAPSSNGSDRSQRARGRPDGGGGRRTEHGGVAGSVRPTTRPWRPPRALDGVSDSLFDGVREVVCRARRGPVVGGPGA